ncbi:hypothetical protein DL93DRAFT_2110386 [Clavulina sp. PMI_390]|nr:hypothetical protein DL93DRAFT_2110386 [Clavulina sp. PMI_390]
MVWTWVNGSDPLHRDAFLATSEELSAALRRRQITAPRLYREHDELRYSTRSVLQYFGEHVRQFHLVAGDFVDRRNTCDSDVDVVTRLGQIPQWLRDDDSDPEELSSNANVPLRIHHHAQFFDHYRRTTFDSCAIEAQMARLEGVDEHFVYMNDDLFFYDHLQPMDFYHPAYGIVLRVQSDLLVGGSNPSYQDGQGEWRPLEFSNWLLDQRYGTRRRSYVQHGPKSMSMSILRELTVFEKFEHAPNDTLSGTFREALLTTGQHTFRGQYTNHLGHDDAYAAFLLTHHIMERWREILLWSWAVGRVGGRSNEWTDAECTTAWIEVGGKVEVDSDADSGKRVEVGSGQRDTLDYDTVNAVLGGEGATTYSFSSLDGYPYAYTQGGPITHWPQFTPTSSWIHGRPPNAPRRITPVCHIEREKCFPSHISTAADAFTHIAFDETACGDCIIRALVNASGKSGLKAFLPDASRTMEYEAPSSQADDYDPMLPLESSWKEVDFSARAVLEPWAKAFDSGLPMSEVRGRVNVREWVMRAMVRYRFVFGDTPFQFLMLRSPSTLSSKLDHLAADKPRPAMFCLNDNLAGSNYEMARVPEIFQRWMTDAWPEKAWWEQ